eukprot:TRINITY_DN17048_c0_g1_i1.p1 TRINITY_DN17048_c0_g1~~TRINITY_DN17048_c0_g1_i1.p1  ORF type:complete len:438 (+),score=80.64 TRINITY_DN17048_c0_g1_i1:318-1631(+)
MQWQHHHGDHPIHSLRAELAAQRTHAETLCKHGRRLQMQVQLQHAVLAKLSSAGIRFVLKHHEFEGGAVPYYYPVAQEIIYRGDFDPTETVKRSGRRRSSAIGEEALRRGASELPLPEACMFPALPSHGAKPDASPAESYPMTPASPPPAGSPTDTGAPGFSTAHAEDEGTDGKGSDTAGVQLPDYSALPLGPGGISTHTGPLRFISVALPPRAFQTAHVMHPAAPPLPPPELEGLDTPPDAARAPPPCEAHLVDLAMKNEHLAPKLVQSIKQARQVRAAAEERERTVSEAGRSEATQVPSLPPAQPPGTVIRLGTDHVPQRPKLARPPKQPRGGNAAASNASASPKKRTFSNARNPGGAGALEPILAPAPHPPKRRNIGTVLEPLLASSRVPEPPAAMTAPDGAITLCKHYRPVENKPIQQLQQIRRAKARPLARV